MSFYQNGVYLAASIVLAIAFGIVDIGDGAHKSIAFLASHWAMPGSFDLFVMATLGVIAAGGMVMFSSAYKFGEASFVAPFEYSSMFWAVLFGFAMWGDIPDRWVVIGGAIVVVAGLYMIWGDNKFKPDNPTSL